MPGTAREKNKKGVKNDDFLEKDDSDIGVEDAGDDERDDHGDDCGGSNDSDSNSNDSSSCSSDSDSDDDDDGDEGDNDDHSVVSVHDLDPSDETLDSSAYLGCGDCNAGADQHGRNMEQEDAIRRNGGAGSGRSKKRKRKGEEEKEVAGLDEEGDEEEEEEEEGEDEVEKPVKKRKKKRKNKYIDDEAEEEVGEDGKEVLSESDGDESGEEEEDEEDGDDDDKAKGKQLAFHNKQRKIDEEMREKQALLLEAQRKQLQREGGVPSSRSPSPPPPADHGHANGSGAAAQRMSPIMPAAQSDNDDEGRASGARGRRRKQAGRGNGGGGGGNGNGGNHGGNDRDKEKCWLCTFCTHPHAKRITQFICNNIGTMDTLHMASQIKDDVLDTFPRAMGIRKRDVLRHIHEHMLHPNVKMASVLRSLVTLAETLRTSVYQRDAETNEVMVDIKGTDSYLKVLAQISNVYKMDGSKMLFSTNGSEGGAAGNGSGSNNNAKKGNGNGGGGGGGPAAMP